MEVMGPNLWMEDGESLGRGLVALELVAVEFNIEKGLAATPPHNMVATIAKEKKRHFGCAMSR